MSRTTQTRKTTRAPTADALIASIAALLLRMSATAPSLAAAL